MKITVHSSKSVKPAYGSPFAVVDVVPLTVFDKASFDQYISGINFFRPPAPPNEEGRPRGPHPPGAGARPGVPLPVFLPRVPPRVEFDHRAVEFKPPEAAHSGKARHDRSNDDVVVVHRAHFSRELLAELRSRASRPYSTALCPAAHLRALVSRDAPPQHVAFYDLDFGGGRPFFFMPGYLPDEGSSCGTFRVMGA